MVRPCQRTSTGMLLEQASRTPSVLARLPLLHTDFGMTAASPPAPILPPVRSSGSRSPISMSISTAKTEDFTPPTSTYSLLKIELQPFALVLVGGLIVDLIVSTFLPGSRGGCRYERTPRAAHRLTGPIHPPHGEHRLLLCDQDLHVLQNFRLLTADSPLSPEITHTNSDLLWNQVKNLVTVVGQQSLDFRLRKRPADRFASDSSFHRDASLSLIRHYTSNDAGLLHFRGT
jgi:hypothetical protein